MRARRLEAYDAFQLFDVGHAGVLTCSQLYSGLCWLQLSITAAQVGCAGRRLDQRRLGATLSKKLTVSAPWASSFAGARARAAGGCHAAGEYVCWRLIRSHG